MEDFVFVDPGALRLDFEAEAMRGCEELMQRAEEHSAKEATGDGSRWGTKDCASCILPPQCFMLLLLSELKTMKTIESC